MRCSQVQNLLPEYVEGALAAAQQEALSAHLCACPTCATEERSYQFAFNALNGRKTGHAPDLWAAFSARLANELSCAEARELIPLQADPALLRERVDALNSHLASCSPCAAESAMMERAVGAIEAVSAKAPVVDLWPTFAARTGNAPARTSVLGSIRRAFSPARNPLAAPILAMAAFAGVLFGAQFLLNGDSQPQVAVQPPVRPAVDITAPQPEKPKAPKPVTAVAKVTPTPLKPKTKVRRVPVAVAIVPRPVAQKSKSDVTTVANVTRTVRPRSRVVAFDPGLTPTADVTLVSAPAITDSNTDAAQDKVMPEVVQAVALLLDFGDSARDPFGSGE